MLERKKGILQGIWMKIFKFDITDCIVIVMSLIQCSDEVQHPISLHPLSIIRISISIT